MSSKIVPIEQAKKLVAYYAADQMFEVSLNYFLSILMICHCVFTIRYLIDL